MLQSRGIATVFPFKNVSQAPSPSLGPWDSPNLNYGALVYKSFCTHIYVNEFLIATSTALHFLNDMTKNKIIQ